VKAGRDERQARDPARAGEWRERYPQESGRESLGRDLVMSQIKEELGRAQ